MEEEYYSLKSQGNNRTSVGLMQTAGTGGNKEIQSDFTAIPKSTLQ